MLPFDREDSCWTVRAPGSLHGYSAFALPKVFGMCHSLCACVCSNQLGALFEQRMWEKWNSITDVCVLYITMKCECSGDIFVVEGWVMQLLQRLTFFFFSLLLVSLSCPKASDHWRYDEGSIPLGCLKVSASAGQMQTVTLGRDKGVDLMSSGPSFLGFRFGWWTQRRARNTHSLVDVAFTFLNWWTQI